MELEVVAFCFSTGEARGCATEYQYQQLRRRETKAVLRVVQVFDSVFLIPNRKYRDSLCQASLLLFSRDSKTPFCRIAWAGYSIEFCSDFSPSGIQFWLLSSIFCAQKHNVIGQTCDQGRKAGKSDYLSPIN